MVVDEPATYPNISFHFARVNPINDIDLYEKEFDKIYEFDHTGNHNVWVRYWLLDIDETATEDEIKRDRQLHKDFDKYYNNLLNPDRKDKILFKNF